MATIRKRGKTYQIRVSTGYDALYRQVVRTKTWKPKPGMSDKQIEAELNKQAVMFEELCTRGIVPSNMKFQELAEKWFDEYAVVNLKKSSVQRLRGVTKRIYSAFGHIRVDKITRGQIQAFIDDLARNGKNFLNGQPLYRKTIIHHLNLLSDVFNYAIRLEMIEDNPCKNIFVPKGRKKEKEIYTVEEMKQLFALAEEYGTLDYRAFLTLAVYSGFRSGELMGLEWKDIDWDNNVISVRRTANYTATDGTYTDTPKTKKSVRSLKLPDVVFDRLRELRTQQLENKEIFGTKWVDSDRIFVNKLGKPLYKGEPYKWQKKLTEEHGMKFYDIHSLRHFNAKVLIHSGIDAAAVSSALGHSSISTTTNIYCHAFNEAQARTGNAIAAALDFTSFPKGEVSENKRTEMPFSERIIAHNSDVAKDI